MQIVRGPDADPRVLELDGRLDSEWASNLEAELAEIVRSGTRRVRIDLNRTTFLSSAGIRVLLTYYKRLKDIGGDLAVVSPSTPVARVLDLSGLSSMLVLQLEKPAPVTAAPSTTVSTTAHGRYERFTLAPVEPAELTLVGEPARLAGGFAATACSGRAFASGRCAIGLAALGASEEDASGRFGEFLAVSGLAVCAAGGGPPDYLVERGGFVPEARIAYALEFPARVSTFLQFEGTGETGRVGLTELAGVALEATSTGRAGIVILAETAGLVGARLLRSPDGPASGTGPFVFPQIRQWFDFASEPAFDRTLVLAVGVVLSAQPTGSLARFVRASRGGRGPYSHVHAAPFTYAPLAKGSLELDSTVRGIADRETLLGAMHLLVDDRQATGAGESEFTRGVMWVVTISDGSRQECP